MKVLVENNNTATVAADKAQNLVQRMGKGETPTKVLKGASPEVKKIVERLLVSYGVDMTMQREVRRAKITQHMLDEDSQTSLTAISASQKEDGVGQQSPTVQLAFNFDSPPDGAARVMKKVEEWDENENEKT